MSVFEGAAVAIITPFDSCGKIDFESFGRLIDFQIDNKSDAIVVCGTTGEASTLTHEEHIECIRYCVEKVAGRVPVIAGTGSNCTETAIYLTKEAELAGADAMLVVTPYYNKATQNGLIAHFTAIANATTKPVLLYNIPGRTGCNMTAKTVAKLFNEVENIVGVKDATGDIGAVADLMAMTDGKIDVYSGNDDQIVPLLSLGGKGVISVLSHVAPKETHDIVAEYLAGNVERARELQLRYIPLIRALFCEVNPIPVKAAMKLMGYCEGTMRMPLTRMEPANEAVLKAEMERLGIL